MFLFPKDSTRMPHLPPAKTGRLTMVSIFPWRDAKQKLIVSFSGGGTKISMGFGFVSVAAGGTEISMDVAFFVKSAAVVALALDEIAGFVQANAVTVSTARGFSQ